MNTGIVNDASKLCLKIFNSTPPNKPWTIINIAKSSNETFTYPDYIEIPTSFGYAYDNVPTFLKDEGVFEATMQNKWFTNVANRSAVRVNIGLHDVITEVARSKGYLENKAEAQFYFKLKRQYVDEGPVTSGQYAVLVNMKNLIRFYGKYNPPQIEDSPTFDVSTGDLIFLGEKVHVEGDIHIKSMALLIKNINSRVSAKELYEIRQNSNYEQEVAKYKKTPTNDIVEQVFKSLKTKVDENDKLRKIIVFVQRDGFGIFIDRNAMQLLTNPQKTPQI